jgi:Putative ATPase subunit of terminase (gpP-like)
MDAARTIWDAYRKDTAGTSVRARAIRLYLAGYSACEIATAIGRTTTPGSIRTHLRAAGLGGLHWCPDHQAYEEV